MFHQGFAVPASAAGLTRRGRRGAKWTSSELEFNFRVNPKAAGIPDCPGEFWPVIVWHGARHGPRDDGTVSYYQYEADTAAMQAMRQAVLGKPALRGCPYLQTLRAGLELPLLPQHPHVALYYADEEDAGAWGSWFGARIAEWLRRFGAAPETLESYAWRVLWKK